MFQFILVILFLSVSSCSTFKKSLKSNRKTANKDSKVFEFESVETLWLKAVSSQVYNDMMTLIEEEKKNIKGHAEGFIKEFPDSSSFFPFRLEVMKVQKFNKDDSRVVSVGLTLYRFTGGAHGNTYHISWNWDNKEKRYLSLRDYVKNNQEKKFKSVLKKATLETVDEDYRSVDWIEGAISNIDIENFPSWNIDGDNIVMTFAPYVVAPYIVGSIEVSVPKP